MGVTCSFTSRGKPFESILSPPRWLELLVFQDQTLVNIFHYVHAKFTLCYFTEWSDIDAEQRKKLIEKCLKR